MMMRSQLNREPVQKTGVKCFAGISKNFGIGFMAAVFAGFIFGILLRLVMGIIAFFFPHMATGFTFMGTLMLVILGIAVTLANSLLYTLFFKN
jgi:hypothetical protein